MTSPTTFRAALLVLSLAGCRGALPCPDCDPDDEDDPMAEGAVPDLPCGGADLQNDALNCGSCDLECPVSYADTEYAIGQCNDGVCGGPFWYETVYTSRLEVIDQSVYISDDDANYRTEIETYLFGNLATEQAFANFAPAALGARPTSVETLAFPYALAGGSELGFSLAWVYDDDALPWELRVGLTESAMLTQINHLALQGYRPISISSRERGGVSEYSAVFVDDGMPTNDWEVSLGLDASSVAVEAQDKWDDGFYPFRGTTEHRNWTKFNFVWTKRPPGLAVESCFNLTLSTFQTEDALRRSEGYHLESLDRYLLNGYDRYAAIWVRYDPCLRWAGTSFVANDPDYVSKYQMFHDQALLAMNFTAMNPGAQWLRPSSTLHIVEGGQTVLNRASNGTSPIGQAFSCMNTFPDECAIGAAY